MGLLLTFDWQPWRQHEGKDAEYGCFAVDGNNTYRVYLSTHLDAFFVGSSIFSVSSVKNAITPILHLLQVS